MKFAHAVLVTAALTAAGCANLNTINRNTALPAEGTAIHLDAHQRVVYSDKNGWVCAEPSPDAMQGYASSLGLGVSAPSKEAVSVAQALSASAGSIGLRTQSITLMRDAMYRICELYFNGAINREAALQLLQRSQDLSLGILAIEQLTGAVVAQQVLINTSSAATAAAAINDTQRELDRAKADEAAKKTAADSAQTSLEAQKKVAAEKSVEAAATKDKAKATQEALDALVPQLEKAQAALEKSIADRLSLRLKVIAFQAKVKGAEERQMKLRKQADDLHVLTEAARKAHAAATAENPKDENKIQNLANALDAAGKAEEASKKELGTAETALSGSRKELADSQVAALAADKPVEQAQEAVSLVNAQIKSLREDPVQMAADKAAADLKAATDDLAKKQAAADNSKKALEQAQANTKKIEAIGDTATTTANATGSGTGNFSTTTSRYGISADTVESLAKATTDIVDMVLHKGRLTDACTAMLMSSKSLQEVEHILPICREVIAASLAVYRTTAVGAGNASAASAAAFDRSRTYRPAQKQPEATQ